MLAQVALIAFALLALLGLVIDVGLLRVTQGQMQTAADAAALEGVRYRDVRVTNPNGQSVLDPFASDCLRRSAAHRVVHATYDSDLDPATLDDTYGAGPVIDLTDGTTSVHALQTASVPESRVYQPELQLNQQNAAYGDMVSGRFCYNADPAPSEGFSYALPGMLVCDDEQRGVGAYARNDFNPSPAAPQPPAALSQCPDADEPPPNPWPQSGSGSLMSGNDNAFLVRLRRSNEYADVAGRVDADIASSGPPLPLLFGRAAPIWGDTGDEEYSVRRDGFTVRATAIADARPAMQVGLPRTNPQTPGVTPFVVLDTFVPAIPANGAQLTINPMLGLMCGGLTCNAPNPPNVIGRYIDNLVDPARTRWLLASTVGQPLPAAVPVACAIATPQTGFGPVYSLIAGAGNRIIGFVPAQLIRDVARPADACAVRLIRSASFVATSNATATLSSGFTVPAGAPAGAVRELLDKHFQAAGRIVYGPVLAPVLAR